MDCLAPRRHTSLPILLSVVLTVTFVAIGVACGSEQAPKEFRIGLIAPITGSLSEVGQETVDAANLAVQEIADAGGLEVGGETYRVVLVIEDNQDKAEVAASAALRLINQQNVIAIVGPQASRNAIPAAGVAERTKIPMISLTCPPKRYHRLC